ncbi:MAG: hypothetical protein GW827_13050 [Flavobacteriales bacterium]|nr:hypothetical protein [Flavobacteriales bacterium]
MKLIKLLQKFFENILRYFQYKKITKTLIQGAQKKNTDRLKLEFLIAKDKKKFLKKSKSNTSEYIPLDYTTRMKLKFYLEEQYSSQMAQLNLRLNDELQLI